MKRTTKFIDKFRAFKFQKEERNSNNVKLQLNFSNRAIYTIITLLVIIIGLLGVYAYTGNVGHDSSQIDEADPSIPKNCLNNQILQWNSISSSWQCAAMVSGGDSDWIISGNDMSSGVSGNVGIGTSSPTEKLDVAGNIKSSGTICGSAGCVGIQDQTTSFTTPFCSIAYPTSYCAPDDATANKACRIRGYVAHDGYTTILGSGGRISSWNGPQNSGWYTTPTGNYQMINILYCYK